MWHLLNNDWRIADGVDVGNRPFLFWKEFSQNFFIFRRNNVEELEGSWNILRS